MLGKSIGFKRRYTNDSDIWAGPLADNSTAVIIINWKNVLRPVTFYLSDVGFSTADATNVRTHEYLGTLRDS